MSVHKPCPDCGGRGYAYSDPDGKQLKCGMCDGYGEVEDKMSEKYSTEELVEEIMVAFEARIESIDDGYTKSGDDRLTKMAPSVKELTQRIKSIIIARLRAADKLCEAAKEAHQELAFIYLQLHGDWKDSEVNEHYPIAINLGKAISDYEGEKKEKT